MLIHIIPSLSSHIKGVYAPKCVILHAALLHQTFVHCAIFPKIENALRGEGMESWRKEKNRYRAHYGALGERGMTKLIQKGKENAQKADENYINAKDKLEDLKNQFQSFSLS